MAGVARKLVRSRASLLPCLVALVSACGSTRDEAATGRIRDPRGSHSDAGVGGLANGKGGAAGTTGSGTAGGNAGAGGTSGNVADGAVAGAGSNGTDAAVTDAGSNGTDGAVADAGSTGGAGGSGVDAGSHREIPSRQSVSFHITNRTNADRYVVTAGNNCTPFSIALTSMGGAVVLPLELGFQCPCECPRWGDTLPVALHRIGGGETYTATWDARKLDIWHETTTCSGGPPLPQHPSILRGVPKPVGPGMYLFAIGIDWNLPQSCSGTDPDYRCEVSYDANPSSVIAPMCSTDDSISGGFTLPETGDVDVPIDIVLLEPI